MDTMTNYEPVASLEPGSGGARRDGKTERLTAGFVELSVSGQQVKIPAVAVCGQTVIANGSRLKIASVMDEEFLNGEIVGNPETFVRELGRSGLTCDVFTFAQKLPDISPKYPYRMEWDNFAAIPITTFSDWWENRIERDVRKAVKRAERLGVVVREAEFNDAFVEGIRQIYNESPVRQGSMFWHYQKDFETVKRENSTFPDRSAYIGAYFEGDLVGFIRMVYVDNIASTLQVISQKKHADKKPTNALIAKAVEICEQRGVSHFVYASYVYNGQANSLTEFKRRNGFEQVLVPRYYVPMTLKGKIALSLDLHQPLVNRIPKSLLPYVRKIRSLLGKHKAQSPVTEAS